MRLVVNRAKPTGTQRPKRATVKTVLADCLADAHRITDVLVVAQLKDGSTALGWSSQMNADLLWLAEYAAHHVRRETMSEE